MANSFGSVNDEVDTESSPYPCFGFNASAMYKSHVHDLQTCSLNAERNFARARYQRDEVRRREKQRRAQKEKPKFDLQSQPTRMDAMRLKAQQYKQEAGMREKYLPKSAFCHRPPSPKGNVPFVTKFHLQDNVKRRFEVAKNQGEINSLENTLEPFQLGCSTIKDERDEFVTQIGQLHSEMLSKFQLDLDRARATTAMHAGSKGVNEHRFRDDAQDKHFSLYFHAARDKNRAMADQINHRKSTDPKRAWVHNAEDRRSYGLTRKASKRKQKSRPPVFGSVESSSCYSVQEHIIGRSRKALF